MGVRGLKTFIEQNNQTRRIDIGDEVNKRKRNHGPHKPIIVFDYLSIANVVMNNGNDTICGGRHQIALKSWTHLLNGFKETGCSLVFFADLNIQESKILEWLKRRNEEFTTYSSLYDTMSSGITLSELVNSSNDNRKALTSTFYGMAVIAQKYGEFNFSCRHEADLELAQYANRHNAFAIVSNDTDFLIFEGSWRLWSPQDIQTTENNRLITIEYKRMGISNMLSLTQQQLPLFATLVGNDFTSVYYQEMYQFHRKLGPKYTKLRNVAMYVRSLNTNHLTDGVISDIVRDVFGFVNNEKKQLFKDSIASYNLNFPPYHIVDPIETKLINTPMYRSYMGNKWSIYGIILPFYDMRGCAAEVNFTTLLTNWVKHRKGIVSNSPKFTLLAKKSFSENYLAHNELAIKPNFAIPPLDQLYSENAEFDEIRWKILSWIMSLSDNIISHLKKLPKEFLLICTTLYALVENRLLDMKVADGILYTENNVRENGTTDVEYPVVLVARYVRAAHIYNIAFSAIRHNFAISGLLPIINEVLQFDGVYFQKFMEKLDLTNNIDIGTILSPIRKYRLYATLRE